MNTLIYLSLILFSGIVFGRLVKQAKLPNVTGYLLAGLILGPCILKLFPAELIENLSIISEIALGLIAFSIGSSFKWDYLKKVGKIPIVITVLEALFAVVFVVGGMLVAGYELPFALCLGSIAAATAPAATIMVIRQYNAKGPVTDTLLTVVAMDDAAALILFGIAVGVAQILESTFTGSMFSFVLKPILEIVMALAIGLALGAVFSYILRWFKKDGNRLILTLAFVFAGIGISSLLNISALLTCMAIGASLVNVSTNANSIFKITDQFTPPIFLMFFVISGAELDITVLPTIGLVGIIYVIMRVLGKMAGSYIGAVCTKAPVTVKKYLGPTLIPQAGVAIGLSLVATTVVPQYAATIRAVVLCATFIYELIGPVATKLSLRKAGEIVTEG